MANNYKRKYELGRARIAREIATREDTVRGMVSTAEILGGAFFGGMLRAKMPTVAQVPIDAGLGIGLTTAGLWAGQPDMTATGIGLLAGYAGHLGSEVGSKGWGYLEGRFEGMRIVE